ncbi:MAG: iron-containing alcohol dehydrogenase, partial [Firmicutes bacterium]|nr:iron-containing alcohol dehydrogenase [Bacillota bacterium]
MALKYSLVQKAKLVAGAGSISFIADVVKDAGYKRPFLVFDKGIKEFGIADKVISVLDEAGIAHAEYDQVVPEPPNTMVDRGADLCKEKECDCVIAIGGGAVIDTAKGITALGFNPGKIMDYAEGKEMAQAHGLIVIPTTSGTGSELSDGMVISDSE